MRIALLTPLLPYPDATSGAPRSIFDHVLLLAERHEVVVLSFVEPHEREKLPELRRSGVRVVTVPRVASAPATVGGMIVKRLRLVTGMLVSRKPVLVQEFYSRGFARALTVLQARFRPDVLLVEHILLAQYYMTHVASARLPVLFVEHDPLIAENVTTTKGKRPVALAGRLDRLLWRRYIRRAYNEADVVATLSNEDKQIICGKYPALDPVVVPLGVRLDTGSTHDERARDGDSVLFVGNYSHPPNVDAALWLRDEIMPLVWAKAPEARLLLVGMNMPEELQARSARVEPIGEVQSVRPLLETCALFAAPVRQGGGVRVKVLEAMAAGAPVVTTPLGAQGLGVESGKQVLVGQTASEIAGQIVSALSDPKLRLTLGMTGREHAARYLESGERGEALESAVALALKGTSADTRGGGSAGRAEEVLKA